MTEEIKFNITVTTIVKPVNNTMKKINNINKNQQETLKYKTRNKQLLF